MKIVFMGTPAFAVNSLQELIKEGHNVCAVVTAPDKPAGRGLDLQSSPVKQFAVEHRLNIYQPVKLKDPEFINTLKELNADLFIVVAFRMLPEEVWTIPKHGTINLHASLLPQYRGAAPINWAIINGETKTGLTTFFINQAIDTGHILMFEEVSIDAGWNAGNLHDVMMNRGALLLCRTLHALETDSLEPVSQASFIIPGDVLKTAPKLNRELCRIDWTQTVRSIHNLIRGLSPYPCAWTTLVNRETGQHTDIKIFEAEAIDGRHESHIGNIVTDQKNFLAITAGGGLISITELQPQGRKRIKTEEFLKGFRNPEKWKTDGY